MKELSIEQKAQRYDEALKEANVAHKDEDKHLKASLERIFPELKESEDERIRKEIIEYFENCNIKHLDWIIWLEKQGQQKSINKTEPKFKYGDLVVDNCDYVWKIEGILNQFYILEGIEGGELRPRIEWVDKTFHLWTVQDAMDGDILINVDDKRPFIYKGCLDPDHPDSPVAYCGIDCTGCFCKGGDKFNHWWTDGKVQPASKEQCDVFFTKIKEAGYEWDAKKKELKIKKENLLLSDYFNNEYKRGRTDAIAQMQKEWSEEDELHIRELESLVKQEWAIAERENDKDKIHKMRDLLFFLKTFKPHLKQEWTEEDESMYTRTLGILEKCYMGHIPTEVEEELNWFKSRLKYFRPQPRWKPSDEQLKELGKYCPDNTALTALYEYLKKLKEE